MKLWALRVQALSQYQFWEFCTKTATTLNIVYECSKSRFLIGVSLNQWSDLLELPLVWVIHPRWNFTLIPICYKLFTFDQFMWMEGVTVTTIAFSEFTWSIPIHNVLPLCSGYGILKRKIWVFNHVSPRHLT